MDNSLQPQEQLAEPSLSTQPQKKFRQYFYEGLMIFIAVSLGFMADNLKDAVNDRQLERVYMAGMIEDLQADTATLSTSIKNSDKTVLNIDSLVQLLIVTKKGDNALEAYVKMRRALVNLRKVPTCTRRTFDQMQSAGLLRLINDHEVSDAISRYYQLTESFDFTDELFTRYYLQLTESETLVFDSFVAYQLFNKRLPGDQSNVHYGTGFNYTRSDLKSALLLSYYGEPDFNNFLNCLNRFQRYHVNGTVVLTAHLKRATATLTLLQEKYN